MKIGTFINHGTIIEIESVQTMNLSVDRGQVCIGDQSLEDFVRAASVSEDGTRRHEDTESLNSTTTEIPHTSGTNELCVPESLCAEKEVCPFTEAQQKASGIKLQAGVVLALMQEMQPRLTQKVDWLSFYSVLLRRCWLDSNLSAFCRMVSELFGVQLDARTLSADLRINGTDYTKWTEADVRIVRRKQLATDFDTRLTEYFERKRAEVMRGIAE